jgi:alkylation response protein AidB-like acyl-CoA dehydrogenase
MHLAFTPEQEELRDSARAFLRDHSGSEQVRRAMESEAGHDPEVWKRIASELGWPAVIVPEAHGGLGLSPVELVALLEIMGEFLLCSPFFASVCLGANAILSAGSEAQQHELLPGICEGQTLATLAVAEASGHWDAAGIECTARREADGYVLSGAKRFVVDGHTADLLIVAARSPGSRGESGVSLFAVPARTAGVRSQALPTLDPTRRYAALELADVLVPASARLGEDAEGWPALRRSLDLAAVALAAEQVGGAQRCLDLSVTHAREREQFGRPIGSFQAIQHKCADMMLRVESARSASYYAACVATENAAELPELASLAKAYCSETYFQCAADALQIHGGVGFTWEYDIHLYLKRAQATHSFLGDPAAHRERVAQRIGLPA